MALPTEHTALLKRAGYPIAPNSTLSDEEHQLLTRYGYWLDALAKGSIQAVSDDQRQFVRVAHGEAEPTTPFERAWCHLHAITPAKAETIAIEPPTMKSPEPPQASTLEVASRLDDLLRARASLRATQNEYAARRATILRDVQPLLDRLDREFSARLNDLTEILAELEDAARDAVESFGESFEHAGVKAVYSERWVTWDSEGLAEYAQSHPEIIEFRRVHRPSVAICYPPKLRASREPGRLFS